ncbi:hypothetical protein BHE90_002732 [Fusarium euwallaceae]|uniref:Heterokaryon incompatibility domain-containing protein n=1 Tax=Fusarium euwallaceae TaxID=1147111 RepID=A0A430M3Z9_9HYPO|nr:hypothetical protein BHE90_002732 [Fusarium euwallaceae]
MSKARPIRDATSAGDGSILDGLIVQTEELDGPAYCWRFQLWRDTDQNDTISYHLPAMSIEDPALTKLATAWIETCSREHKECLVLDPAYRPTRLINIVDADHVRLIISNKEPSAPYVAFSHCWGKVQNIKLLDGNINQFQAGLLLEQLPNTYQEAIRLCLGLGFYYIWIDSLCIIQDSAEDWEREAKHMKLVYEHSIFNLCSATASDSSGRSFIRRRPNLLVPERVVFKGTTFQLIYDNHFYEDITFCTLRSRAWVYQEWYLSKRSLILGSRQLWWHCRKQLACEIRPNGAPMCPRGLWWKEAKGMKEDKAMPANSNNLCTTWYQRVREYARTTLTRESDRLIAFSGVVQSFGQSHGFSIADDYLAGLWRAHLPAALCWTPSSPQRRSATYMAPSWSWASLDGNFIFKADDDLLQKRCYASFKPAGLSIGDSIEIQGYVFELKVVYDPHETSQYNLSVVLDPSLRGQLFWDEQFEGETVISHLEGPTIQQLARARYDQTTRKTMALKYADGHFYYLLILDRGHELRFRFIGLVLYQPLSQPRLRYRIGYWVWEGLPRGISVNQLSSQCSREAVVIL